MSRSDDGSDDGKPSLFDANCDHEVRLTAPDGTQIYKYNNRYEKSDEFRLIMIDAAGFEVSPHYSINAFICPFCFIFALIHSFIWRGYPMVF